jgi:Transcriptional regulatory protein, C terminal
VGLLGPLEVTADQQSVVIGAARERTVLGVLALRAGKTVRADELIEALWGDDPPPSAAKALQTCVWALRRKLPPAAIERVVNGYLVRVDPDELEVGRFERLVALAAEPPRAVSRRRRSGTCAKPSHCGGERRWRTSGTRRGRLAPPCASTSCGSWRSSGSTRRAFHWASIASCAASWRTWLTPTRCARRCGPS